MADVDGPYVNGKSNGQAVGPKVQTISPVPGLFAQALSTIARLATWYTIITILFRCPPSIDLCDETSPRICKPYFHAKHAVAPHLEPYYDAYAAPYVEIVQPYYEKIDDVVLAPTRAYVTKYGAPRLAQAQAYSKAQWEKNVQPQLVAYQTLARQHYDQSVAPHVERVSDAVAPYYDIARTNALQTYHEIILPSYEFVQPYAADGSAAMVAFTTDKALPAVNWAWNRTYDFLDGTVWPQLRVIYVNTVEPQLVRIGQRLGRYNGQEKEKPTAPSSVAASTTSKPVASSFTRPPKSVKSAAPQASNSPTKAPPSEAAEAPITPAATETKSSAADRPVVAPSPSESESEVRRIARETVAEDLDLWQTKFAQAADEGAAEIEDRVDEIAKRMARRQARTMGKALVTQLQDAAQTATDALKLEIIKVVADDEGTLASREEAVSQAVRRVGLAIKEKALDIRNWRENYEMELEASVTKASESHFKILDGIRDLALQKIGMKWAWMDGVTYKDWAKYHAMRDRFDDWTEDLKKLIVTNPELLKAQDAAAEVEDEGMAIAQSTAKELARLKQVGIWKVVAGDATDNFDSEAMQAAAEAVLAAATSTPESVEIGQEAEAEEIIEPEVLGSETEDEAVEGTSEPKADPLESAATEIENATSIEEGASVEPEADPIEDATSSADEDTNAEPESDPTESLASSISESIASDISKATDVVKGSSDSSDSEAAPELASTAIIEPPIAVENVTEPELAKGAEATEPEQVREDIIAESVEEEAPVVPTETQTVKPAFLGAAAQSVPTRVPILDDEDETDIAGSISSAAQSAYAAATSQALEKYSAAMSIVSAQIHGTPKPVHEEMLASVTSVYSAAVAAASSQLSVAYEEASKGIYGTPTTKAIPTLVDWAKVEAIAASRLNEGRAWAEGQWSSAKIAVGLATPTPTTPVEKFLEQAKFNYYAGIGLAHARYSEFIAAASSALSSLTATPTPTDLAGTVSSVASVAAASASSVASVMSENASSIASVVGENASAAAASAGDSVIEAWEVVVNQVSVQIYGEPTPTPWYASFYNAAEEYAGTAQSGVGESVAAVTDAAGEYAASASAEAAKQYAAVSALVSELIHGKEPTFSESVMSRFHAMYVTGVASAASIASAASETVASVVTEATEAVKEKVEHVKDEL